MTKDECILCAQEAEFIGVGECNHEPICYRCIYKMRVISKNNSCPICKTACKQMIIMPEFQQFNTIKKQVIADKTYGDIFYSCEQGRRAFEKLTEYKCFVKVNGKPCKQDKKFPSIAFLKKHLKQDHHRHLCDICCEKKTCVLEQQKLYTFNQLNKHIERGDIDEFGNVVFLHPYCDFCKKHFFDDDQFRVHINLEHITCNVCGQLEKYRYYKNYNNLETHFKMSHYICTEKDCLDKKFIAFKTADELKFHKIQVHDKQTNRKIDIKQLCGFQYEGQNPNDQIIVIKDKEGIDMECQYLSLKKSKNRILGQADQQEDQIFDVRDFYNCGLDQDEHAEKIFNKKAHKQTAKEQIKQKPQQKPQQKEEEKKPETVNQDKKKKYVSKPQGEKQKPQKSQKQQKTQKPQKPLKSQPVKQNQKLMLEDLLLVQSLHWAKWTNDEFDSKLKLVANQDVVRKIGDLRRELFKKKIREDTFVADYFNLMKSAGLNLAYNVFPHFLRTITHEDVKHRLDEQFLKFLKKLPSKSDNSLLKTSNKYSDFFSKFLKEIQRNIESRIVQSQLSLKKPVTKDKARLFQIVGVVRRIKIHQMAKLKFASNFGIQKDTVDFLISKVFKQNINQMQRRLSKIENDQFLDLYVFIKYCYQAIKHTEQMHIEKHKIHENILEDFLYERPHLEQQYGLKKWQLKTMEQKVEFEKLQQEKKAKKQMKDIEKKNQSFGFTTRANFSLADKGDFPQLVIGKKQKQEEKSSLRDIVSEARSKPVTYQKKINEMFPTLGEEVPGDFEKKKSSQQTTESQRPVVKQEKKEKAWWQKINDKKKNPDESDEPEIVKVRQGKNKKQKWVTVKMDGLFGK